MRLVVIFNISDGCTYSYEETVPFEYESAEAFLCDHEEAWHTARRARHTEFTFADRKLGVQWSSTGDPNYEYDAPRVLTIDEWFKERQ